MDIEGRHVESFIDSSGKITSEDEEHIKSIEIHDEYVNGLAFYWIQVNYQNGRVSRHNTMFLQEIGYAPDEPKANEAAQ